MIYYLKYRTSKGNVTHCFTLCSGREISHSSTSRSTQIERGKADISLSNLISTTAPMKTSDRPRQGMPFPRMTNATVHYNAHADKGVLGQ